MCDSAGLPPDAKRKDVLVAAKEVIGVDRLILVVVIERGKKSGSRCEQELHVSCRVGTREAVRFNLAKVTATNRPVESRSHTVLIGDVDAIRIFIGDQTTCERVTARVVQTNGRSPHLFYELERSVNLPLSSLFKR